MRKCANCTHTFVNCKRFVETDFTVVSYRMKEKHTQNVTNEKRFTLSFVGKIVFVTFFISILYIIILSVRRTIHRSFTKYIQIYLYPQSADLFFCVGALCIYYVYTRVYVLKYVSISAFICAEE